MVLTRGVPPQDRTIPISLSGPAVQALTDLAVPRDVAVRVVHPATAPTPWLQPLYGRIQAEGSLPRLFWAQETRQHHDKGTLADLAHLCQAGLTLLVWYHEHLAGSVWWTNVIAGQSAEISVWYARRHQRRVHPRQVTHAVMQWLCETQDLQRIWAKTIFPAVVRHGVAAGGEVWATIPDYLWYNARVWPVTILRATPETLRHPPFVEKRPTLRQAVRLLHTARSDDAPRRLRAGS